MTIKEFNLLKIVVFDGDKEIYRGMCEDATEDLKQRQIKIDGNEGKILKIKLV